MENDYIKFLAEESRALASKNALSNYTLSRACWDEQQKKINNRDCVIIELKEFVKTKEAELFNSEQHYENLKETYNLLFKYIASFKDNDQTDQGVVDAVEMFKKWLVSDDKDN